MAIVLGVDPGKRDCWWRSFATCPIRVTQLKPLDTGQIDMWPDNQINDRLDPINRQIVRLLLDVKPQAVYAERFIPGRRGRRGNVSEHVNVFLGLVWAEARRRHIWVAYVTNHQHKGWRGDEEEWYERHSHLNPHQADATSIALFGWNKLRPPM